MGKKIDEINIVQWGALTGDQWKALSVVEVKHPSPKKEGDRRTDTPSDPRLGEQKDKEKCGTCFKDNIDCPGHFGVIKLPFPVYNKDYTTWVLGLLRCVCGSCGRLRIKPEHLNILGISGKGLDRFKAVTVKCSKVKVCPYSDCGEQLCYYSPANKNNSENDGMIYYYAMNGKFRSMRLPLSASTTLEIFLKIPKDHLQVMGFNNNLSKNPEYSNEKYLLDETYEHAHEFRPEAFIYTYFPVLPPCARPYVEDEDGKKEDDLTVKYNDILELICTYHTLNTTNKSVSTRRGYVKTKSDIEREIMESIWMLTNNKKNKNKTSGGTGGAKGNRPYRSIACRTTGKEGRIHQNINGKRVDFSARTVIVGGGIDLRNDEIGIPLDIAEIETKKMFIGPWNIEYAQSLVREGKVVHVKRKILITSSLGHKEVVKDIKNLKSLPDKGLNFVLRVGDTIRRHLQDGDIVLVNRQPTLRVEGMQAFRAKIIEGMAIMLPLFVTKGYNADFDGFSKAVNRGN